MKLGNSNTFIISIIFNKYVCVKIHTGNHLFFCDLECYLHLVFTLSLAVTLQLEWQYQFQIKSCAVSDSSNCCWQNTSQTARPLARVSQGSVDPAKTPVLAFCAGSGGWEFTNEVMVTCWRLKALWSAPWRTKWTPKVTPAAFQGNGRMH